MKVFHTQFGFGGHLGVFLCWKYLRRKKIVLLSIAAVALSCALLIVVASLFTGFINAVERSSSDHLGQVIISSDSRLKIPQYDRLISKLEQDRQVAGATAVLSGQGLLHLETGNVRAVNIWGIELPKRARVTPFSEMLLRQKNSIAEPGFALNDSDEQLTGFVGIGVIADPDEQTDEYDFEGIRQSIGQNAVLTTGTSRDQKPRAMKFTIADIVFSGIYEFDKNFVYMPIEKLSEQLYPSQGRIADMIQVKLADGADPDQAVMVIQNTWSRFAKQKLGWSDYAISLVEVSTSQQTQARLVAEYRKQMGMLMLIFGVVSGGVVLLVFCIFYLIVMTKQKDIAIVKSCGLGSGAVAGLFLMFGMTVGAVGAGVGIVIGYLVTINVNLIERWISIMFGLKLWKSSIYMFSRIPNQVDWESVLWVAIAAVLAAGIGALIPAVTAARVKPVEILRYE